MGEVDSPSTLFSHWEIFEDLKNNFSPCGISLINQIVGDRRVWRLKQHQEALSKKPTLMDIQKTPKKPPKMKKEQQEEVKKPQELPLAPLSNPSTHLKPLQNQARTASIEVSQDCVMLRITGKFYSINIIPEIIDETVRKMQLLKRLPFLSKADNIQRLIIANVMHKRRFLFGDSIGEEGKAPKSFMVISKGFCKVIWRKKLKRSKKLKVNTTWNSKPLKDFQVNTSREDKAEEINDYFNSKDIKFLENGRPLEEIRIPAVGPRSQKYEFTEDFQIGKLRVGDFIGLRSVREDLDLSFKGVDSGSRPVPKAKFDIIADSSEVIVYELKRQYIHHIPYYIQVREIKIGFYPKFFAFRVLKFSQI